MQFCPYVFLVKKTLVLLFIYILISRVSGQWNYDGINSELRYIGMPRHINARLIDTWCTHMVSSKGGK